MHYFPSSPDDKRPGPYTANSNACERFSKAVVSTNCKLHFRFHVCNDRAEEPRFQDVYFVVSKEMCRVIVTTRITRRSRPLLDSWQNFSKTGFGDFEQRFLRDRYETQRNTPTKKKKNPNAQIQVCTIRMVFVNGFQCRR